MLELRAEQALEFLAKFEFNFDKFAEALRIEENGGKLVLMEPKPKLSSTEL